MGRHMKMTKAQAKRAQDHEIQQRWDARPPERRRAADGMEFADEMWVEGLRLAGDQHTHYQHVMDLVRFRTSDRA
jgi:hypothetical protein